MKRHFNVLKKKTIACAMSAIMISGIAASAIPSEKVMAQDSIVMGDLNANGKVDLDDVLIALKTVLAIPVDGDIQYKAADVFSNGELSLKNVQVILKVALGICSIEDAIKEPVSTPTAKPAQTPQATNSPTAKPTQTTTPSDTSAYAKEVLRLVNEQRKAYGLSEVSWDEKAAQAAQTRAVELATTFSHTRPDGSSCFTALSENNVSYLSAGENIAYGQKSPAKVMEAWMNSDGHRGNILDSTYNAVGIGVYVVEGGGYYWTQLFIGR